MKQPKTPLLSLSILALAALIGPGCGSSTEQTSKAKTKVVPAPHSHAKYLPADAWMVATVRAGQLMEKLDYGAFVHMPAIAFLYSLGNPEFEVEVENPRERELAVYVTRMIENPGESGIDLARDGYFFLGPAQKQREGSSYYAPPMPTFGFVLPMADRNKFENLVELLLEAAREGVRRSSQDGNRFIEHEHWFLAITDEMAFLQGTAVRRGLEAGKLREAIESSSEPSAELAKHLERPFDLGVHLDYAGLVNWMSIMMDDGPLDPAIASKYFDQFEQAQANYEITAEDGRLVIEVRAESGQPLPYDLVGDGVSGAMLDLLPADSIAVASLSLNMEDLRKMLSELSEAFGDQLDMPPLDKPIPGLGLSIDEALSAFSGEITAALINLPDEDAPRPLRDVPEFVLALSTVDPASKVYQDILKKKLLALFDKDLRDEFREVGISLVAKDNRLILGSRGQAAILQAGKAPKPVSGDVRALLSDGYLNLDLDFARLAKALPIDRQSLREEDEFALEALDRLDRLTLHSTEQDGLYETTIALSLDDKKTNLLKQVGTFVANLMDPAWRDPEMRPRIVAARKLAAENPEAFRNGLVGAWTNEWENEWEVEHGDENTKVEEARFENDLPETQAPVAEEAAPQVEKSHGVSKYLNRADGTSYSQHLAIESEGYYLDQNEGRWAVHGNSLLEYNEHGLVGWVGGILSADPQKHEFYWIVEPFEEYDTGHVTRVALDWQLPDPPKGLPKLEREVFQEEDEDAWEHDVRVEEGDGGGFESSEPFSPPGAREDHDHLRHEDEDHGHEGHQDEGGSEFKTSPQAVLESEEITFEEFEANQKRIIERAEDARAELEPQAKTEKGPAYEIKNLITNLSGPAKTRFIAVDLVLEGGTPDSRKIMQQNEFRIRNEALKLLGSYSYEDAQQDGFMERVKQDMTKRFNDLLQKRNPSPVKWIKKLHFTQFIVQ